MTSRSHSVFGTVTFYFFFQVFSQGQSPLLPEQAPTWGEAQKKDLKGIPCSQAQTRTLDQDFPPSTPVMGGNVLFAHMPLTCACLCTC